MTQVIAGAAIAGSVVASSMNMSSPTGLWQAANMMQLFMLLLLFGVYIPQRLEDYLTASNFFSLSFKLPFVQLIPYFGGFIDYIDYDMDDSKLEL
jgi:hypothetical protein